MGRTPIPCPKCPRGELLEWTEPPIDGLDGVTTIHHACFRCGHEQVAVDADG